MNKELERLSTVLSPHWYTIPYRRARQSDFHLLQEAGLSTVNQARSTLLQEHVLVEVQAVLLFASLLYCMHHRHSLLKQTSVQYE